MSPSASKLALPPTLNSDATLRIDSVVSVVSVRLNNSPPAPMPPDRLSDSVEKRFSRAIILMSPPDCRSASPSTLTSVPAKVVSPPESVARSPPTVKPERTCSTDSVAVELIEVAPSSVSKVVVRFSIVSKVISPSALRLALPPAAMSAPRLVMSPPASRERSFVAEIPAVPPITVSP